MLNGRKEFQNVCPSPDLDKQVWGDVVDIFTNDIDMSQTADNQDLLGRTYEYCIQQFAEKEGVSGGEFYTPASVKPLFPFSVPQQIPVSMINNYDNYKW